MSNSKLHHTVPQALLRNFCYDDDKFWYFSRRREKEGVASRSIQKKFARRHYFSTITKFGTRDDKIERELLQVLDSTMATVVRQIIFDLDKNCLPDLDAKTQQFLRRFLYFHQKRSPDFNLVTLDNLKPEQHVRDSIERYGAHFGPLPDEEIVRLLAPDAIHDLYEYARVLNTARESEPIMRIFSNMSIVFAKAAVGSQFIISSNPMLRMGSRTGGILGDGSVELWASISPKYMIGLVGPLASARSKSLIVELSQGQVRVTNLHFFKNSTEVASASETLLRSVVTSKELPYSPHR